ncbi:Hypothetical predicted protein [Paramuricea clavata]|uniref:Uncharacterized protein n=1 Tax=Paramuricea clavata TaxID=317549 RepID=A0A7D9I802_PARCT|nr:Hypothetical predicted protein [Paramuricea clavata]
MTTEQIPANDIAQQKESSIWLTELSLTNEGYVLILRVWKIIHSGFVHRRHDEIRDLLATVIDEVAYDVSTEPALTPLTGEVLPPSANSGDDARVDIAARGFWQRCEKAFFYVRRFLTLMPQHIDARDQRKRKREEETVQTADCRGRA